MPSWPPISMKTMTAMPSEARYESTTLRIR